jgi:lipopolysaccharide cholinephosphotransferase
MKEITLDELKKIELGILEEIDKICKEQNIRYSLCGGTLLGAIRHGGFIPWDDDIDIFMPRPDYNRFVEYCSKNSTPFALLCNKTDERYGYLFAKAMAKNTVIKEENNNPKNIDMGVYVDVFPIDGLADTREEAEKKFSKSRFKRELLVANNWKKFFRSKTRKWYYEPIRFAFFILSRFARPNKLISAIEKIYPEELFENSKYCATICGSYRDREIAEKEVYTEFVDIQFEGKTFKGLAHYDKYLSNIYGDYMKLPPKEKQVSHHMFEAYYKED